MAHRRLALESAVEGLTMRVNVPSDAPSIHWHQVESLVSIDEEAMTHESVLVSSIERRRSIDAMMLMELELWAQQSGHLKKRHFDPNSSPSLQLRSSIPDIDLGW